MAGAEGFEPPSSVLETDSLAVELTPLLHRSVPHLAGGPNPPARPLLHFFVSGVLAALPAELIELETFRRGLPILGRRVILIFALGALQLTDFARHSYSYP